MANPLVFNVQLAPIRSCAICVLRPANQLIHLECLDVTSVLRFHIAKVGVEILCIARGTFLQLIVLNSATWFIAYIQVNLDYNLQFATIARRAWYAL